MLKLWLGFLSVCLLQVWTGEARVLSALWRGPWQHQIVEGLHPDAVVTANFNDSTQLTGWSFLEIRDVRGDVGVKDWEISYLAGMMEANLTATLMSYQWKNTMEDYCTKKPVICGKIMEFVAQNVEYLATSANYSDPYWYQAILFSMQVTGLNDGYQQMGLDPLPDYAFIFSQMHDDLDDLEAAFAGGNTSSSRFTGSGSCSALVKVLPDNSDLLIGHDTWTSYLNMIRIFKLYDFKFQLSYTDNRVIPGHTQVFPSYPGRLYSGDDLYLISSGLVTMETSIENSNPDLWHYITPNCVLENIRVVISNRLATNGKEWTSIFQKENSGTYNNQWMIIDYNLFKSGEDLEDGLLWVLEQMPSLVIAEDQTDMLRTHSYWASYNIPYYSEIYSISGTAALAKKYGDWFTWAGAPRAKMFARNHTHVTDVPSLIDLMKYNNFKFDELSVCNCTPPYSGENAIAARSDLNPVMGTYPFSALGHRLHGAIDMKVTSSKLLQQGLSCYASSSPTFSQQPPFQWTTSGNPSGIPLGHPDKWEFDHLLVKWDL